MTRGIETEHSASAADLGAAKRYIGDLDVDVSGLSEAQGKTNNEYLFPIK